ncbi:hypothetical protein DBZ36_17495 [Alginatibacterium sediminis]|uniref:Uncharacterized protein n=1 Tax=Alginatibacterium sediminis TaxID=2164068 RepID=A0A420E779_9ALTE|nr:hypothetical protein [Alginatibacterium sediminis]RKF14447.1 hypothetical protein DBZ36_17495 [Alginatibacterium sediminis]
MVLWHDYVVSVSDLPTQEEVCLISRHFKMVKFLPLNQQIASLRELGKEHNIRFNAQTEQWIKSSGFNYLQNSKLLENAPLAHVCMLLQNLSTHNQPELLLRHSCHQFLPMLLQRLDTFALPQDNTANNPENETSIAFA